MNIKKEQLLCEVSEKLQQAREYVESKKGDILSLKERNRFHHMPEVGWMNDPNGFSTYQGQYHLFYQYYPYDVEWGPMHWGHAKSADLIKWEYLPIAMAPDQIYETGGCFSGSALEVDGKHVLMYTGHTNSNPDDESLVRQVQCLAIGDGINYYKYKENPVIKTEEMPKNSSLTDFRDPKLWMKDGIYYCVLGSKDDENSARVLLYKSTDLVHWTYIGVVGQSNKKFGYMWECPDIFHLDGQDILMMSPQGVPIEEFRHKNTNTTVYCLGTLDYETAHFDCRVMEEIDYGLDFYAPQTMEDLDGRRIMIAWMQSWHQTIPTDKYGWVTSMTIPRELSIKEDIMYQWPVREIETYRSNYVGYHSIIFEGLKTLAGIEGRHLDLEIMVDVKEATKFEIKVMKDAYQETNIIYDIERQILSFDRRQSKSGINGLNYREMPVPLIEGKLALRLLMDTYSVEIFAQNGAYTMSSTVYSDLSAEGIEFISDGIVELTIEKWELGV
ncbi:MAG: glycoside hydrolase family 32 protein [Turicibacter sp.]|nr:glycoside hydrolase family 32 protein [Turicibacter sp.]